MSCFFLFRRLHNSVRNVNIVCRYYELKMKVDEVETLEDITYIETPPSELEAIRRQSKLESVDAENVISVSQEERKRYVVSAVTDPRDENNRLSLQQATHDGVIHYPSGQYVNPDTGQGQTVSRLICDLGNIVCRFRVNH